MVLVKFMGLLDLATAVIIVLHNYELVAVRLVLSFILFLILKGLMFKGDVASMLDLGIAAYMIIAIFFPITIISWIAALYILQKALVSLFA